MALTPHVHGDAHCPLMQASYDPHSPSERQPWTPKHSKYALPWKPGKQWQSIPWFFGIHSAFSPHESSRHGLIQILLSLSQSL